MEDQYADIAFIADNDGLGYGIMEGYIKPNTDDEELNEAIREAYKGLDHINGKIIAYL